MKKSLFLVISIIIWGTINLYSQNIETLFYDFPGEILSNTFTKQDRIKFLENTPIGQRGKLGAFSFEVEIKALDRKNGFIQLQGEHFFDMCYWNKSDGSKLVATCYTTTHNYLESEIIFYNYSGGNWTELNTDSIFPKETFLEMVDKRATLEKNKGKAIPAEKRISYATQIKLPQKGKDIKVSIELVDTDEEYWDYRFIIKPNNQVENSYPEITYIWNDGTFLKE